jgi:hypothetical protein
MAGCAPTFVATGCAIVGCAIVVGSVVAGDSAQSPVVCREASPWGVLVFLAGVFGAVTMMFGFSAADLRRAGGYRLMLAGLFLVACAVFAFLTVDSLSGDTSGCRD